MQPTAKSARHSSRATGIDPALWHRSHTTSAPVSWTASVIAAMSAMNADRYATWLSVTTAVSGPVAARTCSAVTPAAGSGLSQRTWHPSSAAMPSTTYRSVGKLSTSVTISRRPGRAATAARSSLYSHTVVESPRTT